ncbi:MAG TPA: CRISPR-associated protein Cas4 [Candidatus Bathyarchaeota archaeon]|nr:CRISPR-associated protein Cas4 [Candidatus Bathyarchaeota archaeon]
MRGSISAGESITVFDIVQYHYCPRKVYFLRVLGVPVVVRKKMKFGQEVHDKERRRMMERKRVYGFAREEVEEMFQGLMIEAPEVGLRGQVDVALKLKSGEVLPVDTKFTDEVVVQRQYRKQLHAYALLLDYRFDTNVTRGIIYFSKQHKTRVVEVTSEDKKALLRDIENINKMITNETIPKKVHQQKCKYCEVQKFCI